MWWNSRIFGSSRFRWGTTIEMTIAFYIGYGVLALIQRREYPLWYYLLTPLLSFCLVVFIAAVEMLLRRRNHSTRN